MTSLLYSTLLFTLALNPLPPQQAVGSFLYQPAYCLDDALRGPTRPYMPQPGDIMLATDKNWFWELTHDLALAGNPHNSAIVFARPDGSLAILEAGPNDCLWVKTLDCLPHLAEYAAKGPVWLRRRAVPLTAEQSARLTDWAVHQEGKRFALIRLGAQLTPLRSRGPLRTYLMGGPHGPRRAFFCSELVTESIVAAGLIDPSNARPAATYPHDLFYNYSYNPFINTHFHLAPDWDPPARWAPNADH
jgi:hypothetical protein